MGILFQLGLIVGLMALIAGGFEWVEHLVEQRGQQKIVIAQCQADTKTLRSSIDENNKRIDDEKAAAETRAQLAEQDASLARQEADDHAARAAALLASRPRAKENVCDASKKLLADYATERQAKK